MTSKKNTRALPCFITASLLLSLAWAFCWRGSERLTADVKTTLAPPAASAVAQREIGAMSNLRSNISFFEQRMQEHGCVERCERLLTTDEDEYVYEIARTEGRPRVGVYIADAYEYGLADYLARPRRLSAGDFILIFSFGPEIRHDVIERARQDRIGLGNIGKLMGALNLTDVWKYRAPAEGSS